MANNELKLCGDIYKLDAVNYAAEKYSDISEVSINTDENYYVCRFNNCTYDLHITMQEFENFVIQVSNSREQTL